MFRERRTIRPYAVGIMYAKLIMFVAKKDKRKPKIFIVELHGTGMERRKLYGDGEIGCYMEGIIAVTLTVLLQLSDLFNIFKMPFRHFLECNIGIRHLRIGELKYRYPDKGRLYFLYELVTIEVLLNDNP